MTGDFPYERLDVYHKAVAFDAFVNAVLSTCSPPYAFVDHLDRAAESIVNGLVCGSSEWSEDAKSRHYGIAYGSALECAGCLDIGLIKNAMTPSQCSQGKTDLQHIVRMLVGLIRSIQSRPSVCESRAEYASGTSGHEDVCCFDHENLHAYRRALEFVRWVHVLPQDRNTASSAKKLDQLSTSTVLNIAEGNGRFGRQDHRSFLQTAYLSALKAASLLDRMHCREAMETAACAEGKALLDEIARLVFGMRRSLENEPHP